MKLLNLVLFALTYARVTTRNGGKYTQGVNFDADQSIDDYGNVIERDYDGQFYQQNKESVEWKPTGDYEATTMGTTTNEPESTPEPEVVSLISTQNLTQTEYGCQIPMMTG